MKNPKTLRIPRKLKKKYKKIWIGVYYFLPQYQKYKATDIIVIKDSIRFGIWGASEDTNVWGCYTRFKKEL